MKLGQFFLIKLKTEEKSQYKLVKCVAESVASGAHSQMFFYRFFDKEKIALIGNLRTFDEKMMDCVSYGSTPKEWEVLEESWERYL